MKNATCGPQVIGSRYGRGEARRSRAERVGRKGGEGYNQKINAKAETAKTNQSSSHQVYPSVLLSFSPLVLVLGPIEGHAVEVGREVLVPPRV